MAREQVQQLPGRGVRPSGIRGGTVGVVVQQPEEPAIMGVARALSGVNRTLSNYTQIVDSASTMEEQRIKEMTAEERAAELKKTEGKLDEMERKGKIPFLGNPISWKRKSRALGVGLAGDLHDQMNSDTGRLKNPQDGDDDRSLDEIMGEEVAKFFEGNPQLQSQPTVLNEFNRAWEDKARIIQSQYGDRQSKLVKSGIVKARSNEIYDIYSNLVLTSPGDRTEAQAKLQEAWDEMAFLTTEQRLLTIGNIAKSLAESDPESWDDFLDDAQSLLKVGDATYGTYKKDVADLEAKIIDIIDSNEDAAARKAKRDRDLKSEEDDEVANTEKNTFISKMGQINIGLPVEYEGKTYTNKREFEQAFMEDMAVKYSTNEPSIHADVVEYVEQKYSPIDRDDSAYFWFEQKTTLPSTNASIWRDVGKFESAVGADLEAEGAVDKDTFLGSEEILAIGDQITRDLSSARAQLLSQAIAQDVPVPEQVQWFNENYRNRAEEIRKKALDDIRDLKEQKLNASQRETEANAQIQSQIDKQEVVSTRGIFGRRLKPLETIRRLNHNLTLLSNPKLDSAQREKAIRENRRSEDIGELISIANGLQMKREEVKQYDDFGIPIFTPGIPFTEEERQTALEYVVRREAIGGAFTNLNTLQKGVLPKSRLEFNTDDLLPSLHFILTPDEVDLDKPNDTIKAKAKILNISPEDLLDIQKETYKTYKHLIPLLD